MARILEKAFDAGQKIVRSIFKGAPNLMTTSDLNRQIEAFKYQQDLSDSKVGALSDLAITPSLTGNTLKVTCRFSYLETRGCSFSPTNTSLEVSLNTSDSRYLVITASSRTVTYEDDSSHDIAGAKFADGTSMPAANQMVYYDEKLALVKDLSDPKIIGVLALLQRESSNVTVISSCIRKGTSVAMELFRHNASIERQDDAIEQIDKDIDAAETACKKYTDDGLKAACASVYPVQSEQLSGSRVRINISSSYQEKLAVGDIVQLCAVVYLGEGSHKMSTNVEFSFYLDSLTGSKSGGTKTAVGSDSSGTGFATYYITGGFHPDDGYFSLSIAGTSGKIDAFPGSHFIIFKKSRNI